MVNIEMANGKNIKIELYPDVAPITVANFEKLVKEGFYDGLIFHRVISGFMIQGGDPMGTGSQWEVGMGTQWEVGMGTQWDLAANGK